ncbi:L-2-hydroxyglutarate oxidase [Salinisphaera orenii]|uniref:Hydroxyglutarate oxidase n=1 Tax=Salinisphaera orenii YIM 95161 TaxID=1051139 RepID=A0A423PSJ2_9GAMM|nr:L-2-hydroxyglutarate oxidase [Salinisphaera halophila]ROO28575.1 hydroxyglutarate oxidase [Salinisphaera halophila YIM 95161]
MYDYILIGGGIVGLATARRLKQTQPQARVLLLEKEAGLNRHQTGHNSGVIHAGVYYAPGSLKARFCIAGNRATRALCAAHDIPFEVRGKLLVAADASERAGLARLFDRIGENGLTRTWLEADALAEREPAVRGVAAVHVPDSGIVDYRAVGAALAREFTDAGGEIRCGTAVTGLAEYASEVVVETDAGAFHTRQLVACAGLMADRVVAMLGIDPDFRICPFRGEYYRLAAAHGDIVRHLIYPVPDPAMPFLGVHLTPMIDGSITVGPNAVLALAREGYRKTDVNLREVAALLAFPGVRRMLGAHLRPGLAEMRDSLSKRAYLAAVRRYCPSLTRADLEPHPAGVRAQAVSRDGTLVGDFLFVDTLRTLHVANAPSPAATSALPIAEHIVTRLASAGDAG